MSNRLATTVLFCGRLNDVQNCQHLGRLPMVLIRRLRQDLKAVHAALVVTIGAFERGLMRDLTFAGGKTMKLLGPKVPRAAPVMAVSTPLLLLFQHSSPLEFS